MLRLRIRLGSNMPMWRANNYGVAVWPAINVYGRKSDQGSQLAVAEAKILIGMSGKVDP